MILKDAHLAPPFGSFEGPGGETTYKEKLVSFFLGQLGPGPR